MREIQSFIQQHIVIAQDPRNGFIDLRLMGTDKKQFYSERIDTFEKAFFSSPETTGSDPYLKKISVAYLMLTCWHLVYQGSRCQFQFQTTI